MKPSRQVRTEYARMHDPEKWLEEELGDYFSINAEDREDVISSAVDRALIGFEKFEQAEIDGVRLLQVKISFSSGVWQETPIVFESFYDSLPNPETFLMLCNINCSDDELVQITHMFSNGTSVLFSSMWPFGMDSAVMMVSPSALEIAQTLIESYSKQVVRPRDSIYRQWLDKVLRIAGYVPASEAKDSTETPDSATSLGLAVPDNLAVNIMVQSDTLYQINGDKVFNSENWLFKKLKQFYLYFKK